MTAIRIVIADDHPIVRSGLMGLLASQDDFEVVGEAATGRELVTAVHQTRPDVVLTDLRMPELDGVGAIREMCAAHPSLKILVLTTYDLDRVGCLLAIDHLGVACRDSLGKCCRSVRERLAAVSHLLYDVEGFHGNREAYYEPQNSYLNEVLARRCRLACGPARA